MSYYHDYEKRYRAVYSAGANRWGCAPDDPWLISTLTGWIDENNLRGKRIIEFACGEGACGEIISKLGCRWVGVDVSPSAIEHTRAAVAQYDTATAIVYDCVTGNFADFGEFDAGIDVMGLHMLVTDSDRKAYLGNFSKLLKPDSPALFLRESYRESAYCGSVDSVDEWAKINSLDLAAPSLRTISGSDKTVMLPLLAARTRNLDGYTRDFASAGLSVERFSETENCREIPYSASFFLRKTQNIQG